MGQEEATLLQTGEIISVRNPDLEEDDIMRWLFEAEPLFLVDKPDNFNILYYTGRAMYALRASSDIYLEDLREQEPWMFEPVEGWTGVAFIGVANALADIRFGNLMNNEEEADPGIDLNWDELQHCRHLINNFSEAVDQSRTGNEVEVKWLHVTDQDALSADSVRELLKRYPNLVVITVPPSLHALHADTVEQVLFQHANTGGQETLLVERYWEDEPADLNVPHPARDNIHQSVESFWGEVSNEYVDERKRREFYRMIALGFQAAMYPALISAQRLDVREFADVSGEYLGAVRRHLDVYANWIEPTSRNRSIRQQSNRLSQRLEIREKALRRDMYPILRERRYAALPGGPPTWMRKPEWRRWREIVFRYEFFQDTFLEGLNEPEKDVIKRFYGLGHYMGRAQSIQAIADDYGVTRSAIHTRRRNALVKLGILPRKEERNDKDIDPSDTQVV